MKTNIITRRISLTKPAITRAIKDVASRRGYKSGARVEIFSDEKTCRRIGRAIGGVLEPRNSLFGAYLLGKSGEFEIALVWNEYLNDYAKEARKRHRKVRASMTDFADCKSVPIPGEIGSIEYGDRMRHLRLVFR